jgi:tetratricopeptide (TPR) repeat protein
MSSLVCGLDVHKDSIYATVMNYGGEIVVAGELKVQLLESEKRTLEKKPTGDITAYTFYLKGRYLWNERSKESLEKAIKYFEEAIRMDSRFALAYSGLADTYLVQANYGKTSLKIILFYVNGVELGPEE